MLRVKVMIGSDCIYYEDWAAGEKGGYVDYRYFDYPATKIVFVYYEYFGDELGKDPTPPEIDYVGYCEYSD
ncbi:MAG: hypothetical protein NDF54_09390 [archaeon GB-1867-035]|nr:hypothetical protein [Candidatus Culexmicrobium profundum]